MMISSAAVASHEHFMLGESPHWDRDSSRLLWVDITARTVMQGRLCGPNIKVTGQHTFDSMVSAVTTTTNGSLLVALQNGLALLGPHGEVAYGPLLLPQRSRRRLNDAGTDPAGRLLVGTLCLEGRSETEQLFRVQADGSLLVVDNDLSLSNGLAWSTTGDRMYSVDSYRAVIYVRDYDPIRGTIGTRRPLIQVDDGFPDGIAVDSADHIWVAIWGAGEVRRYSPTGELVDRISVAAPHVSSIAFAGDDLRTLVITTACEELSQDQRRAHPNSGRLFTTHVPTPGHPVPPWAGPQHIFRQA